VAVPSWQDVVAIGERLSGVEAGTWWGTPGLLVRAEGQSKDKGFCRLRTDPDALVIKVADLIEDAWRLTAPRRLR
jgi:hypothetical protein